MVANKLVHHMRMQACCARDLTWIKVGKCDGVAGGAVVGGARGRNRRRRHRQ